MPLGTDVGLGPSDFVLDGDPAPPKRGTASQFSARLHWPNGWMDQDASWYRNRPWPRQHCVTWGPRSPLKGAQPANFRPIYCGQIAGCITIPLGTDVGLATGNIVLHGEDPAPPKMPLGMEIGLVPGDIVLDGVPAPPNFRPMSNVYCGQTVAHLRYC